MVSHFKTLCSVLLLSLLLTSSFAHDGHTCNHDDIQQNPDILDVEEDTSSIGTEHDRVLAESYPRLRIYPYFGFLHQSTPSAFASYIENELVPPVIAYFENAIRMKYPVTGKLKLGSSVNRICDRAPPSILKNGGVDADLFMYYDTYATEKFIAYASSCYLSSGTKRPIVARTMINRNRFSNPKGDVLVHEMNMYTIMHETTHILGFDNNLFNYFLDLNGNRRTGHVKTLTIAGKKRTVLDLPPLTQRLRNYYGCSSLPGAIMENDGGSGTAKSHFETKYFMNELMVSSSSYGRRVSEFTLAFLEGTGWYSPDYSFAEPFHFGQGQGCGFMDNVCRSSGTPKFDEEYCTGSSRGCAAHGRGGGTCQTTDIMEGCRSVKPYFDYDCDNDDGADFARLPELQVFGREAGSKCFTGTLNTRNSNKQTSFCFKYNCVGSGSDTQLEVQVGKHKVTCTQEGQRTLDGYFGVVDCPDPLTFCSTIGRKYCPLNCGGRGKCVNGKCQCYQGFTGKDCAMKA